MDPTISLISNPLNQVQLERAQRLLNYVYDILMQPANSHSTNYELAAQTLSYFEQYLPDKAPDVRARLNEAMSLFPPEQRRIYAAPGVRQPHNPSWLKRIQPPTRKRKTVFTHLLWARP